jgi:hypothetical protein
MAYDGDPKNPKDMSFQVSRLDVRQPTEFLKLGQSIPGTTFKLFKFEFKTRTEPKCGEQDASELTLLNTATNETLVLTYPSATHSVPKPK